MLTGVSRQLSYVFILGEPLRARSKEVHNFVTKVECFVVKWC